MTSASKAQPEIQLFYAFDLPPQCEAFARRAGMKQMYICYENEITHNGLHVRDGGRIDFAKVDAWITGYSQERGRDNLPQGYRGQVLLNVESPRIDALKGFGELRALLRYVSHRYPEYEWGYWGVPDVQLMPDQLGQYPLNAPTFDLLQGLPVVGHWNCYHCWAERADGETNAARFSWIASLARAMNSVAWVDWRRVNREAELHLEPLTQNRLEELHRPLCAAWVPMGVWNSGSLDARQAWLRGDVDAWARHDEECLPQLTRWVATIRSLTPRRAVA